MTARRATIRPARPDDLEAIARLHVEAFPGAFLTQLGEPFLRRYYRLVLEAVHGRLLLAVDVRGDLSGFVAGSLAPLAFGALLRSAKLELGPPAAWAVLRRPALLGRLAANFRRTSAAAADLGVGRAAELTSLAVAPGRREAGLGGCLLDAFVDAARGRVDAVTLTTDEADNEAVRRFYRRRGFALAGRFEPYPGRTLERYRLDLEPAPEAAPPPAAVPAGAFRQVFKRAFDVCASAAGLAALAPLLAGIALAIKASDGGPVCYRHRRVGRHGRVFRMFKFRTMVAGADRRGGVLTAAGDLRVTRIGKRLRRYKLDELPQLVDVLLGRMSLVGPRPESPRYVASADPLWQAVLAARPGVTDVASLAYRDEEALLARVADPDAYYRSTLLPAKLALNLAGVRRSSPVFDLRVILSTVRFAFVRSGFDAERVKRALLGDVEAL